MSALTWTASASLGVWLWLLLARGRFWRTDVHLPPRAEPAHWPSVAVVVPARDEAAVLPLTLPTLLAQDYPGRAEIFLIDDGSADGTGALARRLAREVAQAREAPAPPLTVAAPGPPEPGWTGKLWAVRHGIALARSRTDAAYLLLTDADIAHPPDSLRQLVSAAHTARLDLVSQMARLRAESFWERLIVPAFVYFFAQLYPFRLVNDPARRTVAAAGGCVLLRTAAAERAGVPERIRGAVIDDVTLARAVAEHGGGSGRDARVWLGLAEGAGGVRSVRPYEGLGELWRMVARSAYAQLRHSLPLLLGTVAGLALVYLAPPVTTLCGSLPGALAWAVMSGTYVPMLRHYRQPLWLAPALPLIATLYLLMTLDSARLHYLGRGAAWKGRTYAGP